MVSGLQDPCRACETERSSHFAGFVWSVQSGGDQTSLSWSRWAFCGGVSTCDFWVVESILSWCWHWNNVLQNLKQNNWEVVLTECVGCFAVDLQETQLRLASSVNLHLSSALCVFLHCPFMSEIFLYHEAHLLLHTVESQTCVTYYCSHTERQT